MFDFDITLSGEFLIVKHQGINWQKISELAKLLGFEISLENHFNIIFRHHQIKEHHHLLVLFRGLYDMYMVWHRVVDKTKIPYIDFLEEWD